MGQAKRKFQNFPLQHIGDKPESKTSTILALSLNPGKFNNTDDILHFSISRMSKK
jgi:hypothetical protein